MANGSDNETVASASVAPNEVVVVIVLPNERGEKRDFQRFQEKTTRHKQIRRLSDTVNLKVKKTSSRRFIGFQFFGIMQNRFLSLLVCDWLMVASTEFRWPAEHQRFSKFKTRRRRGL